MNAYTFGVNLGRRDFRYRFFIACRSGNQFDEMLYIL